ncbi:hypothetical protein Z517_04773 [Fonsecaea pedrosoi CBS 271.37]|uniref:SCP domain-containing protein n=1 Tax=Fonsecaea pedrosoi CBS 271.37 TaxID=1442368 RepID=A0A0D2F4Y0_9EURO|nr:uncharacterized protein Z517_04773 [Fonsecaea pedrosoi CBS 271.37]KIW81747.1 hypothetical protein Z517_04773 [Fonsecaea pedrosoi CBS 271.37]
MRAFVPSLLVAGATAQSISFVYTATFTETAFAFVTITTCPCPTSTTGLSTLQTTTPLTTTTATTSATTTTTTTTTISGPILPPDTITSASSTITTLPGSNTPGSSISTLSTMTTTSSSGIPVVTNDAYINAVLRHHNIHRTNHSADPLVWSSSLADTARLIAETCVYGHDTTINGGGYGQNIGAGYPGTPLGMGQFVTEGLYNSEVNNYVAYGTEPDVSTVGLWGHFTQIVWKASAAVGCYTADCTGSSGGLVNAGPPISPFFTVCNYAPAGEYNLSISTYISTSLPACLPACLPVPGYVPVNYVVSRKPNPLPLPSSHQSQSPADLVPSEYSTRANVPSITVKQEISSDRSPRMSACRSVCRQYLGIIDPLKNTPRSGEEEREEEEEE